MASNHDNESAPEEETRFTHRVLAVFPGQHERADQKQEGEGEEEGTGWANRLVHQFVTFDAIYSPSSSILFRFSVLVSGETRVYLQLLPDQVHSLTRNTYDSPLQNPELETIRTELQRHRIMCLRFQLSQAGDLITPENFEPDPSDAEALYNMNCIASLATALDFSVYMNQGVLTKSKFNLFHAAVKAPRSAAIIAALKWKADLSRFYNGKGGVVVNHAKESALSPASYASTVAVATPPEYRGLPEADASTLPTYQQVNPLRKRARSASEDADPTHGKKNCQQSPAAVTTGEPTEEFKVRYAQELAPAAEIHLQGVLGQLLARIVRLEHTTEVLQFKNDKLEAQSVHQQQEVDSLKEQLQVHQRQTDDTVTVSDVVQRIEHKMQQIQEELDDCQGALVARLDSVEDGADVTDVRVTSLENLLDDDWRSELVNHIRGELVGDLIGYLTTLR